LTPVRPCAITPHMSGRTIASTPLASWLDEQLTARDWGVRTLAKLMNPEEPEVARRALNRYLFDGSYPQDDKTVQAIAASLDLPVAEVPPSPVPFGVRRRDVDVDAPLNRDELDMYMALHGRVSRFGVVEVGDGIKRSDGRVSGEST
jgi:hypothetical protein